jgi:hypothetical protein
MPRLRGGIGARLHNHYLFITIDKILGMQHEELKAMASEFVRALSPPTGSSKLMDEWIEKWSSLQIERGAS